jgi:hypothetical protein
VSCNDALLAEGVVAKVPCGNHSSLKNADAALHAAFLYYRIRAAGPLSPSMAPSARPGQTVGDDVARE